jgi:hypothetical protein
LAARKRRGPSAWEVGAGLKTLHKNRHVVKYYTGPWTGTGPVEWQSLIAKLRAIARIHVFCILLTKHLVMIIGNLPTWRAVLFYVFISVLYMFRVTSCSSSRESIVSLHLVYINLCRWSFLVQVGMFLSYLHTKRSPTQWHIPNVVLIQLILLMMSTRLLETCRELK